MESIGYMLIYLLKGSLPWQGLKIKQKSEKYSKIKELKMSLEPEKLCEDLPDEFKEYIESVKNLEFEEEPDYGRYINMFTELFKKKEYVKDYMYDWVEETKKNITKNFKETSMFNDISKITENEISANNNKNIGITTSNMNDRTKKDNEETEKENDETKDGKTEETNKKKDNCIIY